MGLNLPDRSHTALELILHQRACRSYRDDPVDDTDLETMLEAATHAPSAENRQPWVFVVVRDAAARAAIDDLTRQVWSAGGRAHAEGSLAPRLFAEVDDFLGGGYGGAPVLVVLAGDGRDGTSPALLSSSVYPAAQNLLLAAAALGYGSAMTTLAAQPKGALAALVGLPAGMRPFAVIPIGRPRATLGPPRRRPVREVAHRDRFGESFEVTVTQSARDAPRPPAPPPA